MASSPAKCLLLDFGHHSGEIRTGIFARLGGAAQSSRICAIELDPMLGRADGEAVESRDGPGCAADRFDCLFGISSRG